MRTVSGVMYYEMLIQWRRRGLWLILSLFAVTVIGLNALIANEPRLARMLPDLLARLNYVIVPATIVMAVALPLVTCETIPNDAIHRVSDVIETTPMSAAVFLLGKLLSVWGGVLAGMLFNAVVLALWAQISGGGIDLWAYFVIWLLLILPVTLFSSGVGMLVAVNCRTRRSAILVGLICAPYCAAVYVYMFFNEAITLWLIPIMAAQVLLWFGFAWSVLHERMG